MPRRKPRGRPLDGWLIIDKPPGLTSTDVVNRVRRAFDAQKAGHGGTLDPLATGVLAGRLRRRDQDRPLRHGRHQAVPLHAALRRGARHRRRGRQGHRHLPCPPHRRRRSAPRLPQFRGDIMQIPPDLLGGEGRRRARLRHGARGPPTRARTPPRPRGPLRTDRTPRPRHRRLRGRLRQGRLHAQPRPRPRRCLRHAGPHRRAAPAPRRPLHRGAGDPPGQTRRERTIPRRLPRTCCFRSRPRWPTSRRWP